MKLASLGFSPEQWLTATLEVAQRRFKASFSSSTTADQMVAIHRFFRLTSTSLASRVYGLDDMQGYATSRKVLHAASLPLTNRSKG
jgi:hypothetical protein